MSLYWDPSLPNQGGGGTTQTLELNGYTLSLVPNGGSVQLPQNISTLGPTGYISTLGVLNEIDVGPNSNVRILSTGAIYGSSFYGTLGNLFFVNANDVVANDIFGTNGNFTNLNVTNLSPSTVNADQIFTSSISIGSNYYLVIGQDFGPNSTGSSRISQQFGKIAMDANLTMKPGRTIRTDSIIAGVVNADYVNSPGLSVSSININNNILSNSGAFPTWNGSNIYPGQRGDASAWAQFPANGFVNINNNSIGGIDTLYADNTANLGTGKQNATVNVLTTPSFNPLPLPFPQDPPGNFTVGFSNYITAPNSTQPNIGLFGNDVKIAAGAPLIPAYARGRTVSIDAYAGLAPFFPFLQDANSYINITAHGNSFGGACNLGAGTGNITLTAYNSAFGLIPVPYLPGRIYLNASKVDIGNNNYLGLGTSALITMQSAVINMIAGLDFAGISPFGPFAHTRIRSRDGVVIENTPLGTNNRDSRLYVRDIIGYSNFVNDFGPPALSLDGLDGGLTLNNFVLLNAQDGAAINNIATLTGPYATNVQNQINALQGQIAGLSTTGGTSNLALWFQYPALSTVVFNQGLNLQGGSISSVNGVIFNDSTGDLTNTYQSRVFLDGKTPTTGSTMMYYDASAVNFINPSSLSYNFIRGQGFYFGGSNLLAVSSGQLQFNGQNLISTNGSGGGGGGSVGPNPLVSTLTVNYGGFVQIGTQQIQNVAVFSDNNVLGFTDVNDGIRPIVAFPIYSGYYDGGYVRVNNQSIDFLQPTTGTNFPFATFSGTSNISLNNISTINSIPISSFINGNSGPSSIQNWSYFPVLSNSIQFGNQTAWIKGETSALFTTSNGVDTIPVVGQAFTALDANNPGVICQYGLDTDGVPVVKKNSIPTDFRVSTLYLSSSRLTTDGVDLYLNGSNIGSGNTASWANYPAVSTIQGSNLTLSNVAASISIFDTQANPADPRSTSLFLSPFQLQMASRRGIGQNLIGMTNQSNNLQIYNRAGDGATIQTGGNMQNLRIIADTQLAFGFTFTSPSTLTNGLSVSSININGSNNITASNGFLYFNGSALNTGSSVANWASFPASQNVNMFGNEINNCTAVSGGSIPGAGFSITTNQVQFSGPQGVTATLPTYNYQSNAIKAIAGNIAIDGSSSNYMVSPYGYAHQQPTGLGWYNTSVNGGTGQYQIRQFQGNTVISTGTVYDTLYNPLPSFPITYFGGTSNATFIYTKPVGSLSLFQVITSLGTFAPTTKQGIISFSLLTPTTYAFGGSNGYIGVGPVGNFSSSNSYVVPLVQRDPLYTVYNRYTLFCDFSDFIGSNYDFRILGNPSGIFTFVDVCLKPLPN